MLVVLCVKCMVEADLHGPDGVLDEGAMPLDNVKGDVHACERGQDV